MISKLKEQKMEETEKNFWEELIERKLKPISEKFVESKENNKSLKNLRNSALIILLLVNLIWVMLLGSLTFRQLEVYGIDHRALQLLYLAVYTLIILIQFIAMLIHRFVTLIHFLGR